MSSKRTTHRSCRSQQPFNVLLTVIISNSTCLSLGIPPQLACGVCSPRMDITAYSRKRKQNQRHPTVLRWKDDGSALNQLIINSSSIDYDARQEYAQRDISRCGCNIYE